MTITMMASSSVKGNPKGVRRSYQTRKLMILIGAMFGVLACVHLVMMFATGDNPLNERQMQVLRTRSEQIGGVLHKFKNHGHGDLSDSADNAVPENGEGEEEVEEEEEEVVEEEIEDIGPAFERTIYDYPTLKYNTAGKGDITAFSVEKAIHAGFRHFDTDCENKEYNERAVGTAWSRAAEDLGLERSDFFLQTKFTNKEHQGDHDNMPFDANAELEVQVVQSIETSLQNLKTDYIDSYILHFPEQEWDRTFKIWNIMEEYVNLGKIKQLGISHCWDQNMLKYFYSKATIKPKVVLQKLTRDNQYVFGMRRFAHNKGIEFQHDDALTANEHVLTNPKIQGMAAEKGLTTESLLLGFYLSVGLSPLVGTTSEEYMAKDMDVYNRVVIHGEKLFDDEETNEIKAIANAFPIDLKYD